jgi:transposase
LPKYSPDLNPIEMAFSKLKVLIRKAAARTYDDLWKAVGHVCNLFSVTGGAILGHGSGGIERSRAA